MFISFPYTPRKLEATESRLEAIMKAARLGLKGDRLAIAAGMMPTEYRQLCQFDPIVEYAELKARAESEMAMSEVLHEAAKQGDIKAATTILQNQHDWVAKQQINVEIDQRISISQALEMAQSRVALAAQTEEAQEVSYTEVPTKKLKTAKMQEPRYSAQDEMELMARLWSPAIKDNPLAFVMFAFPWGEVGTPLEHFTGPRKWQRQVLNDLGEHIKKNNGQVDFDVLRLAIASGRGIGKSALVSWLVLWMMTTRIGSTVIVSANSESQLRSVTWAEITKWSSMSVNTYWWEISATRVMPAKWLTELVERDLKKGTRYWNLEGRLWSAENPDAFAGVHNYDGVMVVFDEASGIDDSIWAVTSGFFTENTPNRFWCCFSNPRRNTGYFYEAIEGSKRDFWQSRQVDARDVEGTDKNVYNQIIEEYGPDSYQAHVEVYGSFPSEGDDQFIPSTLVDEAMQREKWQDDSAPITIGVDPARFGSDSTVIAVRQGRDIIEIRKFKGDDTMVVVGHVIEAIEQYNPAVVAIDEGGLGAGVVDRLKEQRYKIRGVNFANKSRNPMMYGNMRAQIWGQMKEWLKSASVPKEKTLKTDLISPMMKPDSKGAIFLESKKDMKARGLSSPDSADAIALTFAFPVANRANSTTIRKSTYQSQGAALNSWMGS